MVGCSPALAVLRCDSPRETMTTTTIPVGIKCSCGSTQFDRPQNPQPSDIITCAKCGAKGRWDQVMKQAGEQARKHVADALKDAFRRAGFK